MSDAVRLPYDILASVITHALESEGVPAPIARVEAEVMAEADLLGVPSHGISMLPRLLSALRDGRVTRAPQLNLVRERGATCVLDGDNGPGRYVSVQAMQHAASSARTHGIGCCLAIRTTHWGRAHAYACRAARDGLIGICTTNAIPTILTGGPGSPKLGNNPLAIGVPRFDGRDPVVLDMAMSQAAFGKVATSRREGERVPTDWGVDQDGRPTDDPAAILASGHLLAMGGHKGIGLAVMMELLTGALGGGLFGHEMARADSSGTDPDATKLFVAIDPGAFGARDQFAQRVEDLLAYMHGSGDAASLLFPGERGWRVRDRYRVDGIPIHAEIVALLLAAGVMLPEA